MGKRLSLLDVDPSLATENLANLSPEVQRRMAYTAWGLFNWAVYVHDTGCPIHKQPLTLSHSLTTMFYQQPNLQYPEHPPVLPIPDGEIVDAAPKRLAHVDAHMITPASPWFMGHTFPALCSFWKIMQGVSISYYKNRESPLQEHINLNFAELKYRELLDWSQALPPDAALRDDSPHHVVVLQ